MLWNGLHDSIIHAYVFKLKETTLLGSAMHLYCSFLACTANYTSIILFVYLSRYFIFYRDSILSKLALQVKHLSCLFHMNIHSL